MESFLNPKKILTQLDLRKNMVAVDFGSGSGGWAIPLAKILKDGKVYATDILEEPLSALRGKADIEGVTNIETILTDVESETGSKLKSKLADIVLITNFLFQAKDKKLIFSEAKKILKNRGKILVVDWKTETALGPKEKRISPGEIKKIAKELGLQIEKEFEASAYHWGLVLTGP